MKINSLNNVAVHTTQSVPRPNTSVSAPPNDSVSPIVPHVELEATNQNSVEMHEIGINDNEDVLNEAVKQANQSLKMFDRRIERTIHEVTKAVMYTLRDTKTNEVIAEFPPKKIQDMIAKMWELAGLFVDKKA